MIKVLINQQKMILSSYSNLYGIVVPKTNLLRQIKNKYCNYNRRPDKNPIMMFKLLLIKCMENISDVDLVEITEYDMLFKYSLDLAPEETDIIDAISLTKFRIQRLKYV